jgi:hypothetical protein
VQVVGFACAPNPVGRPQRVVGRLGPGELAAGGGRPVGHGLRVPTSHLDGTSPRLPASRPTATSTWRDHLRHRHGTEAAAVDRGRRVDAQQEHLARLGGRSRPAPGLRWRWRPGDRDGAPSRTGLTPGAVRRPRTEADRVPPLAPGDGGRQGAPPGAADGRAGSIAPMGREQDEGGRPAGEACRDSRAGHRRGVAVAP